MTRHGLLVAIGLTCLLAACQTSTAGWAGRQCEADGQVRDTQEFRNCVDVIYAENLAFMRERGGRGP